MYCRGFWCEFIDLVGFSGCYCLTSVTLFVTRLICFFLEGTDLFFPYILLDTALLINFISRPRMMR